MSIFEVTRRLRNAVIPVLSEELPTFDTGDEKERVRRAEQLLRAQLATMDDVPAEADTDRVVQVALQEMFGLGGLHAWIAREDVSDIWGQGYDRCFVRYTDGHREAIPPVAADDEGLVRLIQDAASEAATPRQLTLASPTLEAQLPDGSRLTAVMAVSERPSFAIRRRRAVVFDVDDLVANGTLGPEVAATLCQAVEERENIVISGATGAGKTTLLRTLAGCTGAGERLVVIEDTRELGLGRDDRHPDVVTLEARRPNADGMGSVDLGQLARLALRLDPDRVIVGEVRGDEVIPMLAAMNQGNDGSMCTVHASSPQGALQKLALYAAMSDERLPVPVANRWLAEAVDLVVQVGHERGSNVRRVSAVHRVDGMDGDEVRTVELH